MPNIDNGAGGCKDGQHLQRSVAKIKEITAVAFVLCCINICIAPLFKGVYSVVDSDPSTADAGSISDGLRSNHFKEYPLWLRQKNSHQRNRLLCMSACVPAFACVHFFPSACIIALYCI